jgi:glycosyltransferase involved in cell wall biosynthesis
MRRILIFSTAYLPLIGGAELAIKEITERLGDDFSFDLICARIKKELPVEEKIGNVKVRRLGRGWGKIDKFLLPWRGFKLAKQLYDNKKHDLVWAIMASFGGLAALFFKEQFPAVPYVLTLQEGDTPAHIYSRAQWLGPYYSKMFKKANFITAISRYLKDYALKNGANCPMKIVPNGVDSEKFKVQSSPASPSEAGRAKFKINEFKQNLGIKENEKIIITVSRLVEKNGIGDLIEAITRLPNTNYKLLILGSGPLEKSLKLKVKNFRPAGDHPKGENLQDRVIFLGNISNDEVLKYLSIADVFVRPSLSEGLGNSFLEAMAAGVPIIGTPVGGIPDFLINGETGLFCDVKNPVSIAQKITQIMDDEILRQKMIVNGKKVVQEKYDWTNIAEKMRGIFNKLIGS